MLEGARTAAVAGDWPAVEALLAQSQARFGHLTWIGGILEEMKALATARDHMRFGKEAHYLAKKMGSRLVI